MIIVKISGGLGNQIYQYAFLKALQLMYPDTTIKVDLSFYKHNSIHNGFELERVFGISKKGVKCASVYELLMVRCEIPLEMTAAYSTIVVKSIAWFNARCRKLFTKIGLRNVIEEEIQKKSGNFVKQNQDKIVNLIENIDINKNWYIDGYWQDELYLNGILQDIVVELDFPDFTDKQNICLENKIRITQSVGVHVRRGDYVGSQYDILTMDYYKEAIQCIEKKVGGVSYFIFTDDAEYVEDKFSFLHNKYIIRNNSGCNSWCDMKLMSLCKYNILSNSSFSNWAGYFNRNENKIIIYPSKYTKTSRNTDKYGEGWIKLNVK